MVKTSNDKQDVWMKLTMYEWVAGKKRVEVMDREVARKEGIEFPQQKHAVIMKK